MAAAVYLADTSVYVLQGRHEVVRDRFSSLLTQGRLAACQMTALEYLNNAADPQGYETLWSALHAQRWIDITAEAMNRALEVHREMAVRSQHRHFRLPDLIIAAAAELNGAVVLHYDADFDRIGEITGQDMEWVAPKGCL
jgi:predicted nucleic acid-binding protein